MAFTMDRRELIQWLGAFALGRQVHLRIGRDSDPTLAIAAERILPGATQANVAPFIERMLSDWHTPEERAPILAGLKALEAQGFAARSEADQTAILTALDQANPPPDWFARLKYLTVYGYCTSEMGMRELKLWPLPWRYDGCAPA
jgi:hypothetical protein